MKILSWNVNGIRAVHNKNALDWFFREQPDILCLQETKASVLQIPEEIKKAEGYTTYFVSAEKKGYSGVGILTRQKPIDIKKGIGIPVYDSEGRIIIAEYKQFVLFNIYFPNGKASPERLTYKLKFYDAVLEYFNKLKKQGKKLIICGDLNTAHKEEDLARPRENEEYSGFLPVERAWIDRFLSHGYLDTFRMFTQGNGYYSWWDYKTRARERNIGWRIDYFFISENLQPAVRSAFILTDITGSDHCPVGIELTL